LIFPAAAIILIINSLPSLRQLREVLTMTGYFRKIIFVVLLSVLLIPCAVRAQENGADRQVQTYSNEELAQMLAPIALYPDALLSQILMAAAYPFEVAEADRWVSSNPYVTGDDLDEALQAKDWDVSVLALCHYPKVLAMMSENLSWTAALGDAFTYQEEDVMDTVQELRNRAYEAGNLSTTDEQKVIVEERIVRIEPYSYDYFYVPAYDPYYVYGSWWLPLYPPFAIFLPGLFISGPGIIYSPRIEIGFGVFGWSRFNWHARHVIITDIYKTRKFNRHYNRYQGKEHHRWRPDTDRRFRHEKRGGEIPRYRPPRPPSHDRRVQPSQSRPKTPGTRTGTPEKKRTLDKSSQPASPRDKNQRPGRVQPPTPKDRSPVQSAPPAIDRGGQRAPLSGAGEKRPPAVSEPKRPERSRGINGGPPRPVAPAAERPRSGGAGRTEQPPVMQRSTRPPAVAAPDRPVLRQPGGRDAQSAPPVVVPGAGEGRATQGTGAGRPGEGVRTNGQGMSRPPAQPAGGRGHGPKGK